MILKLDFDSTREFQQFRTKRLPWIRRTLFGVVRFRQKWVKRSPSGRGWHVTYWAEVPNLTAFALYDTNQWSSEDTFVQLVTCALQLALGSDYRREVLFLGRILRPSAPAFWKQRGNILFSRKLKPKKKARSVRRTTGRKTSTRHRR